MEYIIFINYSVIFLHAFVNVVIAWCDEELVRLAFQHLGLTIELRTNCCSDRDCARQCSVIQHRMA